MSITIYEFNESIYNGLMTLCHETGKMGYHIIAVIKSGTKTAQSFLHHPIFASVSICAICVLSYDFIEMSRIAIDQILPFHQYKTYHHSACNMIGITAYFGTIFVYKKLVSLPISNSMVMAISLGILLYKQVGINQG